MSWNKYGGLLRTLPGCIQYHDRDKLHINNPDIANNPNELVFEFRWDLAKFLAGWTEIDPVDEENVPPSRVASAKRKVWSLCLGVLFGWLLICTGLPTAVDPNTLTSYTHHLLLATYWRVERLG